LGASAALVAEGAREAGMPAESIRIETSHESISQSLRERLVKGDCILVKGSRAAAMERVFDGLAIEENR